MNKNIKPNSGFASLLTFAGVGVLFVGLLITSFFIYRSRIDSPEEVFADMILATEDIDSFSYTGEFRVETENPDTEEDSGSDAANTLLPTALFGEAVTAGDFEGAADFSEEGNPLHEADVDMSLVSQREGTRVEFFAEGSIRANKNNIYIRFSELPDVIPFFSLSGLKDQWLELEFADVERKNILTEREAFIAALEKYPPFTLKRAASERVNGTRTTKYLLELDRDNVVRFNREFKESIGEQVTEAETQGILISLQNIEEFEGYIWIGKDDKLPHRFSLTTSSRGDTGGLTNTHVDVALSEFNEPKNIEMPEESKTLEDVLEDALGGLLPEGLSSEGSTSPDSDSIGDPESLFEL